ncbi:MAG: hypothetical protein JO057_14700 [Chloroflexi bacterium]|nr:hypothetical protein [Chloroflexota bacterium]
MPVWNGVPTGPVTASITDVLNATQFYVHALLDNLRPGQTYHYRFVYRSGSQVGSTPDATLTTAPDRSQAAQPFTFTAYGDQGITGAPGTGLTLDNAPSLQSESSSHITNVSAVAALVSQIAQVRNPA